MTPALILPSPPVPCVYRGFKHSDARRRCTELADLYRLNERRGQLAGTLSGGERQRLALAAAVLQRPELLFLDEPTSAVDPQSRRNFWDSLFALSDQGTTLLVSTHYMDEAERCHRLAILQRGRLVADDSPRRLTADLPRAVWLVECDLPRRTQQVLAVLPVAQLLRRQPGVGGAAAGSTDVRAAGATAQSGGSAAQVEIVNYYNSERRAAMNSVPGLIGVILTMTMVMFTAMALVRERERGNLEFMITTPLSPLLRW
ncbi:ATP-binding cassette domain-containing protein [Sedimenticola sp.]|uniref:ATP-binding cassette domain-containing protein n=1 Tax=Sedimenticola sp. TaxID=1940285 RepID=UPI003D0A8ED1